MTAQEQDYTALLYRVVNYGITFQHAREAESVLQTHLKIMSQERELGHPNGMIAWHAMMEILKDIVLERDRLRSKESAPEYFWLPYTLK